MPIEIDNTETIAPATVPLVANLLYVDRLTIDEHDRPASDADVMLRPPSIDLVAVPYAADVEGRRTYAAVPEAIRSANAYALAAVVPEVGQAMAAIFAAVAAVRRRVVANADALADAETAAADADAAVDDARSAADDAESARAVAFVARNAVDDAGSAAWGEAQAALVAAGSAYTAALVKLGERLASAAAAHARVSVARLAVADPANPPLPEADA